MAITAIIPTFNDEIYIGNIVLKTKKHVDYVIVVDKGSTDNTAEIAKLAGANVVQTNKNLEIGFQLAQRNGTKVIVTIYARGYHDPDKIPNFIHPILAKEADMVISNDHVNVDRCRAFAIDANFEFKKNKILEFIDANFEFKKSYNILDFIDAGLKVKEIGLDSKIMNKPQDIKVVAALPAHNEENYIAKVVLGCQKLVNEVLVIDDGSVDATSDIAKALGAIVVKHDKNKGYGAAIKTCFKTAKDRGADLMIILDADGQHDPKDMIKLIETAKNRDVDIVIGSRFTSNNGKNVPAYRKFGMKILDFITIRAGSDKVSDSQSGFRAYSRKAIERIHINGKGMSVGSEILLQAKDKDLKIAEEPIICRYDQGESSQNPINHGLNVLFDIFIRSIYKKPLLYLLSIGMIFLIIGTIIGTWSFHMFVVAGGLPFGPSIAMLLFLILGSISIFSGLILHNMGIIIREIKNE